MVTIKKCLGQFLIKFLAMGIIILTGISNCERIIHSEVLSPERFNNRLKAFNEWYSKLNPSSKVEAKLGDDNKLHLISKTQIKAEETYITVDRNLTIHPELVYNTKIGNFLSDLQKTYGYDDHLNMVLYLVHEMGNPDSFWKPYLDILPRQIDNLAFKYWDRKVPIEEELLHTPFLSKKIIIFYIFIFNN
jgi:hypothetical protein